MVGERGYTLLPKCSEYARDLVIAAACDGASSVGQVANEVARILTKSFPDKVRMCCLAAIAAGSELHVRIFRDARAVLAVNGRPLEVCEPGVADEGY